MLLGLSACGGGLQGEWAGVRSCPTAEQPMLLVLDAVGDGFEGPGEVNLGYSSVGEQILRFDVEITRETGDELAVDLVGCTLDWGGQENPEPCPALVLREPEAGRLVGTMGSCPVTLER
jgi:hypothetical protein